MIDAGQGTNQITFHVTGSAGRTSRSDLTVAGCSTSVNVPITAAPSFSQQPTNQTVCLGATATFTASAGNSTYQWYIGATPLTDGTKYAGTTTGTLSVFDSGPSDAVTNYNVVATGCGGSTTSNNVSLTINPNGCFDSQFAAGSNPTRDWTNDVPARNSWTLDGAGNYITGAASTAGVVDLPLGLLCRLPVRSQLLSNGILPTCGTS